MAKKTTTEIKNEAMAIFDAKYQKFLAELEAEGMTVKRFGTAARAVQVDVDDGEGNTVETQVHLNAHVRQFFDTKAHPAFDVDAEVAKYEAKLAAAREKKKAKDIATRAAKAAAEDEDENE